MAETDEIVARLREFGRPLTAEERMSGHVQDAYGAPLVLEAADEIERLRAELAYARRVLMEFPTVPGSKQEARVEAALTGRKEQS